MSQQDVKRKPGRPRSAAARQNILSAAVALLEAGGVAAVTMEAIAKQAKVGKPTIYRYWQNAHEVVMTALMEAQPELPGRDQTGAALDQLKRHLKATVAIFSTPRGRSAAMLVAAADSQTEVSRAFRHHVILKSRAEGKELLDDAVAQGELPADFDTETGADALYGPVFFRLLLGHQPLNASVADDLIAMVLPQ